jgi:hypothetical protein
MHLGQLANSGAAMLTIEATAVSAEGAPLAAISKELHTTSYVE